MLETIREYAADLLATLAEKRDLRRAHARHYAKLFASQSDAVRRWDESAHASVVDEFDNARAALDWAVARGDEQTTARVVAGLWFLWLVRGNGSEATAAAESLLRFDLDLNEPDSLFGAAAASEILRATGERERALAIKRRCLVATYKRPNAAFFGDRVSILTIPLITDIASLECELGDLVSAHNHASDALAKRRQVGRESGIAHALCVMSQVALYEGDPEVAAEHLEEALKLYLAVGQETEALGVRISLAECLLLSGEVDTAIDELRSYIDGAVRADAYYGAEVARIVSTLAAQRGRPGDSARLAGFHSEALARAGLSAGPREQALLERGQQPVRSALEHDYDEFVADGRRLDLDDVVVLSLKVLA
jgi:tetratricopeptide (TPR) repeat protein